MLRNDDQSFGSLTKLFHWGMFLLFAALFVVALIMGDMPKGDAKLQMIHLHMSLGITALGLVLLRILWRVANPIPAQAGNDEPWAHKLAQGVVGLLYLLMVLVPIAGWAMVSLGGHQLSFFGLFTLPPLTGANHNLHEISEDVHGFLAWSFFWVIALHFVGALRHHVMLKDRTLLRMLPGRR